MAGLELAGIVPSESGRGLKSWGGVEDDKWKWTQDKKQAIDPALVYFSGLKVRLIAGSRHQRK
jgi:hypothetical protein